MPLYERWCLVSVVRFVGIAPQYMQVSAMTCSNRESDRFQITPRFFAFCLYAFLIRFLAATPTGFDCRSSFKQPQLRVSLDCRLSPMTTVVFPQMQSHIH